MSCSGLTLKIKLVIIVYWTKEWRKIETDVDEEVNNDLLSPTFHTAEEGLKWLNE